MTIVRSSAQQVLAYVPHTSVTGSVWQKIKPGTTTSAGASDGTTLIDTNGDSGGADNYNGLYWVRLLSGSAAGSWKRIIDDDGAGTLTFENNGFPAQVASGVSYEIWKSPEPVVVVDSSSGSTDMVDAVRSEADDFWNGYWVIPITGSRRGEKAQITDFTSSTGTFVVGSGLSGALSAGDVVLIRKFVEATNINDGTTEGFEQRVAVRRNFSSGDGVVTARGGTFSFDTELRASGSAASTGNYANPNVLSGLFLACGFDETVQKTATVGIGSSTTAIAVATGSWESFTIGGPVVWNGNLRWVTALTDGGGGVDTVTVTPALPTAPASGDLLYGGRMYTSTISGSSYGVLIEREIDSVRVIATGCKGNVTINDGARIMLSWSLQVDHWIEEVEGFPGPVGTAYSTAKPMLSQDRLVWLGTTATNIDRFTASINSEHSPVALQGWHGINGRCGYALTTLNAGCTFSELVPNNDALSATIRFDARTAFAVICVWGTHENAAGVRIPVGRTREQVKRSDVNGVQMYTSVVQAQDAGYTTNGASAVVKVPDFTIGIM